MGGTVWGGEWPDVKEVYTVESLNNAAVARVQIREDSISELMASG